MQMHTHAHTCSHTNSHTQIKRGDLQAAKERLENGVDKIAQASAQVADLQVALKDDQIVVEEKKQQVCDWCNVCLCVLLSAC